MSSRPPRNGNEELLSHTGVQFQGIPDGSMEECVLAPRTDTSVFPHSTQCYPSLDPELTTHHPNPSYEFLTYPIQLNTEQAAVINGMWPNVGIARWNVASQATDTSTYYEAPRSLPQMSALPGISAPRYWYDHQRAPFPVNQATAPRQCYLASLEERRLERHEQSSLNHQHVIRNGLEQHYADGNVSYAIANRFCGSANAALDAARIDTFVGIGDGCPLQHNLTEAYNARDPESPDKTSCVTSPQIEVAEVISDGAGNASLCSYASTSPVSEQTGFRRKGQELYRPDATHTEKCPECYKFYSVREIRRHARVHGSFTNICEFPGCTEAFLHPKDLRRHYRDKGHGSRPSTPPTVAVALKCPYNCYSGRHFSRPGNLERHMQSKHPNHPTLLLSSSTSQSAGYPRSTSTRKRKD